MQKRVGDIEEFAFDVLTDGQQLHITLAISGWLADEEKGKKKIISCPGNCFFSFLLKLFYKYVMDFFNSKALVL